MMWLALALVFQLLLGAHHSTVMASGLEVCSADGAVRVDAGGSPLSSDHGHACCCTADFSLPPTFEAHLKADMTAASPAALFTLGRLSAQWLAPLSRGPPALI